MRRMPCSVLALAGVLTLVSGCGKAARLLAPPATRATESAPMLHVTRVPGSDPRHMGLDVQWRAAPGSWVVARDPANIDRVDDSWVRRSSSSAHFELPIRHSQRFTSSGSAPRDPHVIAVRSVLPDGTYGRPGTVSWFGDSLVNIAPEVQIVFPRPSSLIQTIIPTGVTIRWEGRDPDGRFTTHPVKYKYKLFSPYSEFTVDRIRLDPDSLRRFYAPAFAGWDSLSGDTTTVRFTNLTLDTEYMFVVVAFDELGDYSPVFSLNTNCLWMSVGSSVNAGPAIEFVSPWLSFGQPSGNSFFEPASEPVAFVPADDALDVNWSARTTFNSGPAEYRWALDLADPADESPRSGPDDLRHWSPWDSTSTRTILPAFHPLGPKHERHRFLIQARDGFARTSILSIGLIASRGTFTGDVLIVNDTRREFDLFTTGGLLRPYTREWPSASELDTLLVARGGVPWRGYAAGTTSLPGLFAGYVVDTMSTRRRMPTLNELNAYRHVIWMTDPASALTVMTSPTPPLAGSVLRAWSAPQTANLLATYVGQGGDVWLMGGAIGYANLVAYNRPQNDLGGNVTFSSLINPPEIAPGRLMHDAVGWRSEFRSTRTVGQIPRSLRAIPDGVGEPDYTALPASLRPRSPANDPLPPGRSAGQFYVSSLDIEYLSQPNLVLDGNSGEAMLDTLYDVRGGSTPFPTPTSSNPIMTNFHPRGRGRVLFSGFGIWSVSRSDARALVEFVLQRAWGLTPSAVLDAPLAETELPGIRPRH